MSDESHAESEYQRSLHDRRVGQSRFWDHECPPVAPGKVIVRGVGGLMEVDADRWSGDGKDAA